MRVLVAVAMIAIGARASADPSPGASKDTWLHQLVTDVRARLAAAAAVHAPKPPVRIAVKWRPQRLGSLDLGAPLVALAAADLDGDGKAELYAVTPQAVIAIAAAGRVKELARVPFAGDPAVPRSRDPVGSAIVVNGELVASTSSWARSLHVAWKTKQLAGDPGEPGFELCAGERAQLQPGRNYFGDGATAYYGVRCADLVDAKGLPLHARAQLSLANKLDVTVSRCAADGTGCTEARKHDYAGVGVAFALADVDRDGTPELIFAGAGAPGDPDVVRVVTLGADIRHERLKKSFSAGGV
ncbi:MAG: hypothetical protein ACM31C_23095, partial [Acidobacteriota bacterium]